MADDKTISLQALLSRILSTVTLMDLIHGADGWLGFRLVTAAGPVPVDHTPDYSAYDVTVRPGAIMDGWSPWSPWYLSAHGQQRHRSQTHGLVTLYEYDERTLSPAPDHDAPTSPDGGGATDMPDAGPTLDTADSPAGPGRAHTSHEQE